MQTAPVMNSAVLQNRPVNAYTDLMVHHIGHKLADDISQFVAYVMHHQIGHKLADDISQGQAGPDEFRTTPLWGVGQRIFFMHDGRTADLLRAIREHRSEATSQYPASEANGVVHQFNSLSEKEQQAILDFLRSL
jgi:CxxC motif-containing protein (DUF1111 family)